MTTAWDRYAEAREALDTAMAAYRQALAEAVRSRVMPPLDTPARAAWREWLSALIASLSQCYQLKQLSDTVAVARAEAASACASETSGGGAGGCDNAK